jgi:hypothetical protein
MRTVLVNFGCLILSILFLPLFFIFIGPLLVLAALRGRQPVGPIIFNTSRYGLAGRIGALMLGLAIWILVWSGLAWVVVNGLLPASTVAEGPSITPSAVVSVSLPTPPAESQTATPPRPSSTFTVTPTPLPPTPTPSSTPTNLIATASPTPTSDDSTPIITETPLVNTPQLTIPIISDQSTASDQLALATREALTSTLTLADRQAVINTVEEGNLLLREAISLANQENIQKLETVWQGQALTKAQNFVTDLYGRYIKPFEVQFEYIVSPTISSQSTGDQVIVVSQEAWFYRGPTEVNQETFEFTYTLDKEEERWVITRYSYLNLPTPVPTVTPDNSG